MAGLLKVVAPAKVLPLMESLGMALLEMVLPLMALLTAPVTTGVQALVSLGLASRVRGGDRHAVAQPAARCQLARIKSPPQSSRIEVPQVPGRPRTLRRQFQRTKYC